MSNHIEEKQFEKISEIVHLHMCKDSYITSNDFILLLSEYSRNKRLERIIGYVSPYTRFSKVLRQYIYGLDHQTQLEILNALAQYLKINDLTYLELFSSNLINIRFDNEQFQKIFLYPLFNNYRCVFNSIGINDIELPESDDNLHSKFLTLSNEIYKQISKNFDLPLIELRDLEDPKAEYDKVIDIKNLRLLLNKELISQQKYIENMRYEYKKVLRGYNSNIKYHQKKGIIEKYDRDAFRTLKRKHFISDYELIKFIESEDNKYFDLFEIDKIITKNLHEPYQNDEEIDSFKYLGTKSLLDKIFATKPQVIIIQQFARDFDYDYYNKLSYLYGVSIYPSSLTTWKEDEKLRFRKMKLISFIFGLNLLFNEYVR